MKKVLGVIIKKIYKFLMIIIYRPKIIGKGNIPKDTAAIICPNHVHALDSTLIISMNKRHIKTLAKEELFKNRFFKFLANIYGIYPVKANNKSMESIKISLKILKNNELLMIFPEGTRNGMEKGVKPKDGAIKLAIKSNTPIVPVGVQGNFKPFKKIKVNIGKPIYYSKYKDEVNNKDVMDKLTEELMKTIVKLRDERI